MVMVAALSLAVWPAVAEEPTKPRLRKVTATGNRDVVTLDNGTQFKGVILREKDKAIRFLVAASSGKIHQVNIPLSRIKRIEQLATDARKVARAEMEDIQAEQRKATAFTEKAVPDKIMFFWRARNGITAFACDSRAHIGGGRPSEAGPIHYLTPSGIHLMQQQGYRLIELRFRTLIPVFAAHQDIVDQATNGQ